MKKIIPNIERNYIIASSIKDPCGVFVFSPFNKGIVALKIVEVETMCGRCVGHEFIIRWSDGSSSTPEKSLSNLMFKFPGCTFFEHRADDKFIEIKYIHNYHTDEEIELKNAAPRTGIVVKADKGSIFGLVVNHAGKYRIAYLAGTFSNGYNSFEELYANIKLEFPNENFYQL